LLSPSDLANFEAQASTNLVSWATLPNALSLTNGMFAASGQRAVELQRALLPHHRTLKDSFRQKSPADNGGAFCF